MKKHNLYLIFFILFLAVLVEATILATFSDGTNIKNLTYTEKSNLTVNISVPLGTVSIAQIGLTGFNTSTSDSIPRNITLEIGDSDGVPELSFVGSREVGIENAIWVYNFEQSTGNLSDVVDAKPSAAVLINARDQLGLNGGAWDFASSWVKMGNGYLDDFQNVSYVLWIKIDASPPHGRRIISSCDGGAVESGIFFNVGGNPVDFKLDTTSGTATIQKNLFDGQWIMLSMTYKNGNFSAYMNDTLLGSSALTGTIKNDENFVLGAKCDTFGNSYDGLMDEFYVFNYSLTQDDIRTLYDAGKGRFAPVGVNRRQINKSVIQNVMNDGCVCSDCVLTANVGCQMPFKFASQSGGILQLSDLLIQSGEGIDNCTNSFGIDSNRTFNITTREERSNNLLLTNGTFLFTTEENQFTSTIKNRISYQFCTYPDTFDPIGDMSHTFTATGFNQNDFNRFNIFYLNDTTLTAYLLPDDGTVATVLYTIVDSGNSRIEGATMSFYRIIGGVQTLVFQAESDFAGQVSCAQDQTFQYFINITHPNYPVKEFSLKPVLTEYTIKLTEGGEVFFNNPYAGTRYKIEPGRTFVNISQSYQPFKFTLESNSLEFWGINISRTNYSCIPTNCSNISSAANGGIATVWVNVSEVGSFYMHLFFKKEGQEITFINQVKYFGGQIQTALRSSVQLFQDIKANTSPLVRTVLVGLGTVVLIGIATAAGVAGPPIIAIAVFANIFFALPVIGFINPIFGLLVSITGLIMYALSQR